MSSISFLPRRESDLVNFSTNFNTYINANAAAVGLTMIQAAAYTVLHDAWVAAYNAVNTNPNGRTPGNFATKNTAKANLIDGVNGIRQLVEIIQAFPGTTDTERADLWLTIRDTVPTPVPIPAQPPILTIVGTLGRSVKVALADMDNPDSRAKPFGVKGAAIVGCVGAVASSDPMKWSPLAQTSTLQAEAVFPDTVPSGSTVWLRAYWFNNRNQTGPACAAQMTSVSGTMAEAA
jgi:hypothetical protein